MENVIEKAKQSGEIVSPWKLVWRRFRKNGFVLAGTILLIVLLLLVIVGPLFSPYGRDEFNLENKLKAPSASHWLGTDEIGRDYFTRLLYGGQISLSVGLVAVAITIVIGVLVGGISGYFGGIVDSILMRFAEIVYSFPFIPLIITLSSALMGVIDPQYKIFLVMALIGLLSWPGPARVVRGQILSLREQEFMEAATALGISDWRKITRHLIPNTIGYIIIYAMLEMAGAILTESALSFLGMGVQPPTPSWGNMIQYARQSRFLENYPWLWIPPGISIFLSVMSVNLLGEGLRNAFDPKS